MLEAVFALLVFAGMALMFAAAFPTAARSVRVSGAYAQAAALAQHKIEQLRAAGFTAAQNPATLATQGILDSGSASGSVPYVASFAQVDQLSGAAGVQGIFPAGTTGTVSVCDYSTVNVAVPAGTVLDATVTIQWPDVSGPSHTYSASTLVIQMPHN